MLSAFTDALLIGCISHLHNLCVGIPRICDLICSFCLWVHSFIKQIYLTALKAVIAHYHSFAIVTSCFH